jgi:hypothetical protein
MRYMFSSEVLLNRHDLASKWRFKYSNSDNIQRVHLPDLDMLDVLLVNPF